MIPENIDFLRLVILTQGTSIRYGYIYGKYLQIKIKKQLKL